MKAIILAGGLGTRLRPLTQSCPKPLLPVGNLPIVARIVSALRKQNVRDFLFLLHYQPEAFIRTLGNGAAYDASFQFEIIEKDLSTAGSVKHAGAHVRETCLIYSADIFAEVPVERMLAFHRQNRALATIALYPMPAPLPFGIVMRRQNGAITRFLEKPTWPQVFSDWINSSIYLAEPELIDKIPGQGQPALFEKDVFPQLARAGERVFGFPLAGYWRDLGTPEDLRHANIDFLQGRLPSSLLTPEEIAWQGDCKSFLAGPSTVIDPRAKIHETVIGRDCKIAAYANVSQSVLMDEVEVASGAEIHGAIIMNEARIGAGAVLHPDSLIGEGAVVQASAVIERNGTLKPGKTIAAAQIVTAKRVLPTGYLRRFVDGGSLLGYPSGNFNPELMRWVGKAFALAQAGSAKLSRQAGSGKNELAVTSRLLLSSSDHDLFADYVIALAQGMAAAGMQVELLTNVTLPVTRRKLASGKYAGAIYFGLDDFSGLLRLVLLRAEGENFSTAEACALERIEMLDESRGGEVRVIDDDLIIREYLSALLKSAKSCREFGEQPPGQMHLGVTGSATERVVRHFFEALGWPVSVTSLALEISPDFGQKAEAFQRDLQNLCEGDSCAVFWMGSLGERMRFMLPGMNASRFGVSDLAIAHLLSGTKEPERRLVEGWLMPEFDATESKWRPQEAPQVTGMNSSLAALARSQGLASWYGFDGNGGITVSEWLGYHDALMTLAHVLPSLKAEQVRLSAAAAGNLEVSYQLLPCRDEVKAQVMRCLLERFENYESEVNDGVKLKTDSGWVVVRLCAGREAIEVFKCGRRTGGRSEVECLLTEVLQKLTQWVGEVG